MANFYAMCDVFALPSRSDCFASVQVEAMLCGTPVVAADIPGARQVVLLTGMGTLVPPRSPEALAEGIATVLNNPATYRKPSDFIQQVFDYEVAIDTYESLLQELTT